MNNEEKEDISPVLQEKFDYGTVNETNEVLTFTDIALQFYFPRVFMQRRRLLHNGTKWRAIHTGFTRWWVCMRENKQITYSCPLKSNPQRSDYHFQETTNYKLFYDIPHYYVPQALAEMVSMKVDLSVYCSWSMENMVVLQIPFDRNLCKSATAKCYQLQRRKALEILVWLLSDVDRT